VGSKNWPLSCVASGEHHAAFGSGVVPHGVCTFSSAAGSINGTLHHAFFKTIADFEGFDLGGKLLHESSSYTASCT
jgi:hypothetical protein